MISFDERGIPIQTMNEKLLSLTYCLEEGNYEDTAGHLCDLLEYCRLRIHPSVGKPFCNLHEMIFHYGSSQTPIGLASEGVVNDIGKHA